MLSAEELGDRKPTHFLRRLQQLAGDTVRHNGIFIRELVLQQLPANVHMVLASTNNNTLITELAQLANKVMEVTVPTVSKVSVQPSMKELELLQEEIASLKQEIKVLKQTSSAQASNRHSPSPHCHSPSRSSAVCWYHQKFGTSAKKCRPPCSQSGNDLASH